MSAMTPTIVARNATVVAARKPNLSADQKTNTNNTPRSGLTLPGGTTWGRYRIIALRHTKHSPRATPSVRVGLNGCLPGGAIQLSSRGAKSKTPRLSPRAHAHQAE